MELKSPMTRVSYAQPPVWSNLRDQTMARFSQRSRSPRDQVRVLRCDRRSFGAHCEARKLWPRRSHLLGKSARTEGVRSTPDTRSVPSAVADGSIVPTD